MGKESVTITIANEGDQTKDKLNVAATLERLRESLWLIPGIMVIGAATLAIVLTRHTGPAPSLPPLDYLLPSDIEGARAVLQVVAATVVTVTSVVFSLTVIALQITAGNYSPRILRTFLKDLGTQLVLGTFLATFAFTYLVLQNVQTLPVGVGPPWGPESAFLVVPILVAASLMALVFFIDHVTRSIRVDLMTQEVLKDLLVAIDKTHGGLPDRSDMDIRELVSEEATPVTSSSSGFVQAIGAADLIDLLQQTNAEVIFRPTVGDHVLEGATVAWVWSVGEEAVIPHEVKQKVLEAVQVGAQRSLKQDVAFGIRQLVDIAVRSLSSGVNDPNTAVTIILHLAVAYRKLLECGTGPTVFADEAGRRRAAVPNPSFDEYLYITTQQISHYGKADLMIILRLLRTLGELRGLCGDLHRDVLVRHIAWVLREAELGLAAEGDRETARMAAKDAVDGSSEFRHYTAAG